MTYSLKYRDYQKYIRERQIEHAKKYLECPLSVNKHFQDDTKRFIKKTPYTSEGEIAEKARYDL